MPPVTNESGAIRRRRLLSSAAIAWTLERDGGGREGRGWPHWNYNGNRAIKPRPGRSGVVGFIKGSHIEAIKPGQERPV